MATYTITNIEPSSEDGFVYADVLVNKETEPRRLILPEDTVNAKAAMKAYLQQEEEPEPVVEAQVVELLDKEQRVAI